MDRMLEVELPTEDYYDALAADMGKRFPHADPLLLEHVAVMEPLLDVAIVTGFSFGVKKALLAHTELKWLGEIIGRERRTMTDDHRRAIIDFPEPIPGVPELRRFLGVVNWTRLHQPAEFAQAAAAVTKYLSKNAEWLPDPPFMKEERGQRGTCT